MPQIRVHRFAACELDEMRRQLRRDGALVRLGPRVFDLLVQLVRQSHRVVPHGELRAAVWPGQRISDAAVHACVSRAREAIGDRDDAAPLIRTFTRYGYRFVAEVRTELASAPRQIERPPGARDGGVPPAARASAAGFFGRQAEIELLATTLDAALSGGGRLAVVCGDHGAGKTRLAEEVARRAEALGLEVLAGDCIESGSPPPFWPWAQIVRRYAAHHDPEVIRAVFGSAAADVAHIAPALRDRCPDLVGGTPIASDHAQLRVHESLLAFVVRAAAVEPLLIVVDELQWADAASLRVLEALAAELPHIRAVVLALVESAGAESRVETLFPAARADRPGGVRVELAGMPITAVRDLMAHALGRPVPAGTARLVGELSGGNPLVVLDTLGHLAAASLLPPAQATWPTRQAIVRAGVAEATCAMVNRRLAQLDAPCRRVIGIAAIAGAEFVFAAIDRVAALAGDAALPAIESAVRAGLIRPIDDDGARYRFVAPYVCAAIRQRVNPTRRTHVQAQLSAAVT